MAQTATVGAEATTHYGCDLIIEDGIVASGDIETDATGCLVGTGARQLPHPRRVHAEWHRRAGWQ